MNCFFLASCDIIQQEQYYFEKRKLNYFSYLDYVLSKEPSNSIIACDLRPILRCYPVFCGFQVNSVVHIKESLLVSLTGRGGQGKWGRTVRRTLHHSRVASFFKVMSKKRHMYKSILDIVFV